MPTSSGRADPFNPWSEAQQGTVIYQSAGWLGMDCLPALAALQLQSSTQPITVMCRLCCLSTSLAPVSQQIHFEGVTLNASVLLCWQAGCPSRSTNLCCCCSGLLGSALLVFHTSQAKSDSSWRQNSANLCGRYNALCNGVSSSSML